MGTKISWTEQVWNPTTGCDRSGPGCDNCYALAMARRLKAMGKPEYQQDGDPRTSGPGFAVQVHPGRLALPGTWKKPRRVFVNSMSDLFHPRVPDEFIARVFAVMANTPQHVFQVLTKRSARMRSLLGDDGQPLLEATRDEATADALYRAWPVPNVWLGVSVEDQERADKRIPDLLKTPAAVRWASMEPLLGPIDLFGPLDEFGMRPKLNYWLSGRPYFPDPAPGEILSGPLTEAPHLDWVVTGGESGPGARPADLDWFRGIRDQCQAAGVAYFHKQHGWKGANGAKKGGRLLDGVLHDAFPDIDSATARTVA